MDKKTILKQTLGDKLFNDILNFYSKIFEPERYDLIIFIARKSWCLYKSFEFLIGDGCIKNNVTNDKMIAPWLASHNKPKNIAVVDDTLITGASIRDCIKRLHRHYNIESDSVTVHVYTVCRPIKKADLLDENNHFTLGNELYANWEYDNIYFNEFDVKRFSRIFIKTIHAVGIPYVAHIPAFTLSIKSLIGKLFKTFPTHINLFTSIVDSLQEWDFKDITTDEQKDVNVYAFCLFPPQYVELDGRPTPEIEIFTALRFYVNFNLNTVLFVPYTTFKSQNANNDIRNVLPDILKSLCDKYSDKDGNDNNCVGQRSAHRLLKYVSSYKLGKYFLTDIIKTEEYKIESHGGLSQSIEWFNNLNNLSLNLSWDFIRDNVAVLDNDVRNNINNNDVNAKFFNLLESEKSTFEDYGSFHYLSCVFNEILKYINDKKKMGESHKFYGIPMELIYEYVMNTFGISKNDFYATILKLGDSGIAMTHVVCPSVLDNSTQRIIGTALLAGELATESTDLFSHSFAWMLNYMQTNKCYSKCVKDIIVKYVENHQKTVGISAKKAQSLLENYYPNTIPYTTYSLKEIQQDASEDTKFFIELAFMNEMFVMEYPSEKHGDIDVYKDFAQKLRNTNKLLCYEAVDFILTKED